MNVSQAVRAVCLALPEAEERLSHGHPEFRVRGKSFATYMVNHHGDGRVALWLNTALPAQQFHCEQSPKHFFVPPYVGPRGWLGVHLDKGLSWKRIAELVHEAYRRVAPRSLAVAAGKPTALAGKIKPLSAVEIDPLRAPQARRVLARLREICLALPESSEGTQFGSPVFRAGKKTFASLHCRDGRITVSCWVGAGGQSIVSLDPRYHVPRYTGHNGWIALDLTERCDWNEIRELALTSYRHFALKRMLAELSEG